MNIEFSCSQCQSVLRIPETAAGKQVRCPKCSAVVAAPSVAPHPTGGAPLSPAPLAAAYPAAPGADVNPYAAPLHSPATQTAIPDLVGGPLEVGYVLSRAWEIFKIHWGLCLVAALIPTGIQQLASFVLQILMFAGMAIHPLAGILLLFLGLLALIPLAVWLNIGQMLFFLRVAQGETPEIPIMFRGAPWILPMIGLWFLVSIMLTLAFWVCFGVPVGVGGAIGAVLGVGGAGALVGVAIGGLFAVAVLVYLLLAYSQSAYLLIDRNTGVIDSLRGSWQLTRDNKLAIFLTFLLVGLINMAGALACGIGLIATMPYTLLAIAVMYTVMAKGNGELALSEH